MRIQAERCVQTLRSHSVAGVAMWLQLVRFLFGTELHNKAKSTETLSFVVWLLFLFVQGFFCLFVLVAFFCLFLFGLVLVLVSRLVFFEGLVVWMVWFYSAFPLALLLPFPPGCSSCENIDLAAFLKNLFGRLCLEGRMDQDSHYTVPPRQLTIVNLH